MSLRLRAEVSATDTKYGAVLLDERSGDYWKLNPTGALILLRLLAGDDPAQAAAALVAEYEVDEARALLDVTALLDELRSARLVMS